MFIALGLVLVGLAVFIFFDRDGHVVDDKKVYYVYTKPGGLSKLKRETQLDPETFVKIDSQFAKDAKSVYFGGDTIPEADPLTFTRVKVDKSKIQDYYSRDKNNVYRGTEILKVGDLDSFQVFAGEYWKDSKQVCHNSDVVIIADPQSFEVVSVDGVIYGKDKFNMFLLGKPVENKQLVGEIGKLVSELNGKGGLWLNGAFPQISLGPKTPIAQVTTEYFTQVGFSPEGIMNLQIQDIKIVSIDQQEYIAVLVTVENKRKILLTRFESSVGWWIKEFSVM